MDRVGLGGGRGAGEAEGANTGVLGLSKEGAEAVVGLGCAVDMVETAGEGWCAVGTCPLYTCPNSPGLNVRFEQNPSDELMSSVSPSLDLR